MIDRNANDLCDSVMPHQIGTLVKVNGIVENLISRRLEANFVFTKRDQSRMGVIAVAAAVVGMGGQAIATASNASSMEESADFVEFNIGEKIFKGWLWRNPFSNGEEVSVAAEWTGAYYEVFGICRPEDRMIALYPHCSRAKTRHIKNAIKWWFLFSFGFTLFMFLMTYLGSADLKDTLIFYRKFFNKENPLIWIGGYILVITIPILSMTRRWMPFVQVSEKIFMILDLPDAKNIDLVKSSRMQRKAQDNWEFGSMYFRY